MTESEDAAAYHTLSSSGSVRLRPNPARRSLAIGIGVLLAAAVPSLAGFMIDDRLINGISVWSKPLKFQASFAMLLATLFFLLPLMEPRSQSSWGIRLSALTATVMSIAEIAYITIQALRGRASHFNTSTPLEAMLYTMMGAGAFVIMIATFYIGFCIIRHPLAKSPVGLRLGAGWGLAIGAILTTFTAFVLGSGAVDGPGHWVGGIKSDAAGLFLAGWSRSGGDLRVPHFFATHIMQALPVLGLCLDRFAPNLVRPGLLLGAIISIAVVGFTFVQAVSGRPFL